MTLEEIKTMDKEMLTPAVVASFLEANPQSIRVAARTDPESLGFPVNVMGTRTRIPRRAFIQFVETGGPWFSRKRKED